MTDVGQQLINSVRAHAAENPDFIYQSPFDDGTDESSDLLYGSCVYLHQGCASCLIGHALLDAGLIDLSLEARDDNHVPVKVIIDTLGLTIDQEERLWLRDVQNYQDTHYPWGEAVALADRDALSRVTNPDKWTKVVA